MNAAERRQRLDQTLLVTLLPERMRRRFVDLLLDHGDSINISPGDELFARGETNTDQGCVILEGAVKITLADGKVRYLEAPEILGEVQLFTRQAERTATVESVTGGQALLFEWLDLGQTVKSVFSDDDLAALRGAIQESARLREQNLLSEMPRDDLL